MRPQPNKRLHKKLGNNKMTFLDDLSMLPDWKKPEQLNSDNGMRQGEDDYEAPMRELFGDDYSR
jgi:hypothetical protein